MAEICILTEDRRLLRMLTLLLKDEYAIGDAAPSLLITDSEQIPTALSHLPCLLIGEKGLPRPFSHRALLSLVASLCGENDYPSLTPTEARLFDALKRAEGLPVSREALSLAAFGDEKEDGRLNLYIHYLRRKIETDGRKRIFACRGKGYYYHAAPSKR